MIKVKLGSQRGCWPPTSPCQSRMDTAKVGDQKSSQPGVSLLLCGSGSRVRRVRAEVRTATHFIRIVLDISTRGLSACCHVDMTRSDLDSPVGFRGVSSQQRSPG